MEFWASDVENAKEFYKNAFEVNNEKNSTFSNSLLIAICEQIYCAAS
jgi:predicted enzyme related to lactoylglutathione lyase